MRKSAFIAFFLLGTLTISLAQGRFRAGMKAGISTSQVHGDTFEGFHKFGFDGGLTLNAKINEKWRAQFEILFVQKGSKFIGDAEKGDTRYYRLHLNYVEVPILFQYVQKKFTFELGPGVGYLINYNEQTEWGEVINGIPVYSTEISGSVGIQYAINPNWNVNWRFTNSILPIRNFASGASIPGNGGQRNNVLAFTLTYTFGKKDEPSKT